MKKIILSMCSVALLAGCSRSSIGEPEDGAKHFAEHATTATFMDQVLKSEEPVIVAFHATWCVLCRQAASTIEALAKEYDGRIKVVKVDINNNPVLAKQYQIDGLPTYYSFKDGKLVDGRQGPLPKRAFVKWFESLLL